MLAFVAAVRRPIQARSVPHRPRRLWEPLNLATLSPKRMSHRTCLAIVLAAGEGTRMRTSLPKALHAIGGRTLLEHVLTTAAAAEIAIVVGPDHGAIEAAAKKI